MRILLDIVAVAIGLAAGAAAGYWVGRRWQSDRRMLWTMAGVAFATAWIVDVVGYIAGAPQVSIGSIGLMAGIATGVKYGGFSPIKGLGLRSGPPGDGADVSASPPPPASPPRPASETRPAAWLAAPERGDAPAPEDADASRDREQ